MDAPPKTLAGRIREMGLSAAPRERASVSDSPGASRQRSVEGRSGEMLQPEAVVEPASAVREEPIAGTRPAGGPHAGHAADLASVSVDSSGAIVPLSHGAPGSLPVLEAIQAFLAEERALMRRRFRVLTVSFVGAMLLVLAASVWAGWHLAGRMRREMSDVRGEMVSAHDRAMYLQQQATGALQSVTTVARTLHRDIDAEKKALSSLRAGVDSKLDTYAGELGELRELLKMLRLESASMKDELAAVREVATSRVEVAVQPEQQVAPASPVPPGLGYLETSIRMRKDGPASTWRLPFPE